MKIKAVFLSFIIVLFFSAFVYSEEAPISFVKSFGVKGSLPGEFNEPFGVAVDGSGFVYVTDVRNSRVEKFTSDGEFILEWGKRGFGDGEFQKPVGIAVDNRGFVYVSDYDSDNIQKFDSEGRFILKWGASGNGQGEFDAPSDIAGRSAHRGYL